MNQYEQRMKDLGCPECGGEIELYNTDDSGRKGQYRCLNCGRDTYWAIGRALSFKDVLMRARDE